MILNSTSIFDTNFNGTISKFTIENSDIAFDILSNRLYSDNIMAIVRELLTNAYDSQIANGNSNDIIDIELSKDTNIFSIRDYGTGLSEDDIFNIYTSFFNSTKSSSNNYTGCFGLGSKTPFAYTDSFIIESWHNNIYTKYIAIKKDNCPSIAKLDSCYSEEHTGLKISIPIKSTDIKLFTDKLREYLKYIPEIHTNYDIEDTRLITIDNITIYNNTDNDGYSNLFYYIKQGQNIYKVRYKKSWDDDSNFTNTHRLDDILYNFIIVYEVAIGTLEITPNREQLTINEINNNIINNISKVLKTSIIDIISNNLDIISKNIDYNTIKYNNIYNDVLRDKLFPNDNDINSHILKEIRPGYIDIYALSSYTLINKWTSIHGIPSKLNVLAILVTEKQRKYLSTLIKKIKDSITYKDKYIVYINYTQSVKYTDSHINTIRHFHSVINIANNSRYLNYNVELITFKKLAGLLNYRYGNKKKYSTTFKGRKNTIISYYSIDYSSANPCECRLDTFKKLPFIVINAGNYIYSSDINTLKIFMICYRSLADKLLGRNARIALVNNSTYTILSYHVKITHTLDEIKQYIRDNIKVLPYGDLDSSYSCYIYAFYNKIYKILNNKNIPQNRLLYINDIKNTYAYKKFDLISKLINKYNFTANILDVEYKDFYLSLDKDKKYTYVFDILRDTLKDLYEEYLKEKDILSNTNINNRNFLINFLTYWR